MMQEHTRNGLADALVSPRFAAWRAATPWEASMTGDDLLALGLLGGATAVLPAADELTGDELPFALPEAARRAAGDEDADEDEDEDDAEEEDEDYEDEDEDEDEDEEDEDFDDEDEDDEDDDEDEDEEDEEEDEFLDEDEDEFDDEEEEFSDEEE